LVCKLQENNDNFAYEVFNTIIISSATNMLC
jgi:hypothetical protein